MIEPVRVKAGKKMNTKQFLSDILDEFNKIDYVKPEDIPNIDLYMDQVTTFMDSQLATSKRHEDDKILTKTMINNYAKNDLLPPPEKKKYSKEHVLTLIFIYYFKSILSISDIQSILNPITDKYFGKGSSEMSLEDIYKEVFGLEHQETLNIMKDLAKKFNTSIHFWRETGGGLPEETIRELVEKGYHIRRNGISNYTINKNSRIIFLGPIPDHTDDIKSTKDIPSWKRQPPQ